MRLNDAIVLGAAVATSSDPSEADAAFDVIKDALGGCSPTRPGSRLPMRRVAATALALAMMASVPAQAQSCRCMATYASHFTASPRMRTAFDRSWRSRVADEQDRRVVIKGVYDYEREQNTDKFCNRHRKACKAVVACLIAGGTTYLDAKVNHASDRTAERRAAIACASAALGTMAVA